MKLNRERLKVKINSISTTIASIIIPIFQYVPCTGVWFGIMSVPFIAYLLLYVQNPGILISDINFLFRSFEIYIFLFGLALFIYSLTHQLTHKKQLIRTGPYKYVRHPQYLAFIIMTFSMTLIAFQTSPIFNFNLGNINGYAVILFIWIAEVFAYIILAKIEEYALKVKYGDKFLEYVNDVSFMIPFLKFKRNKIKQA